VRAAETFYNVSTKGKATLSFEINHAAGLSIPAWRDISSGITERFLATLSERGVSSEALLLIRNNLDIEKSLLHFSELSAQKFGDTPTYSEVIGAHDIASVAHAKDSFARPQDTHGLFHIPYMQHSRNIAIYALELNLSGRAAIIALLHDVVEDSNQTQDLTLENLKKSFDREVCDGVMQLTKAPGQSRADFLSHVGQLTEELAVVKALDRYDNLIRAFGLQDPQYHARLLNECVSTYDPIFQRETVLKPLRETYELLKRELAQYHRRMSTQA
jgi:(p)ppGpp synthase/HD superfamily hydrolase